MTPLPHSLSVAVVALFWLFRLLGHFTEPRLSAEEIRRVAGDPARIAPADDEPRALRVVTWNIARGIRFEETLAALIDLDAHVVLLQEADRFCGRSNRRDVPRELAEALQMNWIFAGEFQEIGEGRRGEAAVSGQAILSRYPIGDAEVIAFERQARFRWRWNPVQPRRGGRMALKARTAGLLVYNLHIESGGGDALRRDQLGEVVDDQAQSAPAGAPVVIAGDFNSDPPDRSAMFAPLDAAGFVDALGPAGGRRTSNRKDHPIDWIFVRSLEASNGSVTRVERASDHHPLRATLALPD